MSFEKASIIEILQVDHNIVSMVLIQVKVLRSMKPLQLEDVIVGQYKGHSKGGKSYPAYTDDPTVPKGSITPTFAAAALFINNARWDGVPFLMKAGKALHTRRWANHYHLLLLLFLLLLSYTNSSF